MPFFYSTPLTTQEGEKVPAEGALMDSLDDIERVPLAESVLIAPRGLPAAVDLAPYFPQPGNQGNQGSCVGWASTYALKTYHEKRKNNWDLGAPVQQGGSGEHVFSPAWTYNQINKGRDRGAHMPHALDLLIQKGAVSWKDMPYNQKDFRTQPTAAQKQLALRYRAKSYESIPPNNISAIKAELAKGYPMLIGVYSGPDRWNCCKNNGVLDGFATARRAQHAMVLVGYDDNKRSPKGHRGAFKIMDSSGDAWGTHGFGYISYDFTPSFLYAVYVLRDWDDNGGTPPIPMDKTPAPPKGVRASQGAFADKISVSWQRVTDAVSYQIERSDAGAGTFSAIGYSEEARFSDEGAAADTAFDYRVIAVGEETNSAPSAIVRGFTATQSIKPVQVTGLSSELSAAGSVLLSWSPQFAADKYVVARKQKTTGEWKTIGTARNNAYTDAAPEAGDNSYTVSAQKGSETGSPSEAVTIGAKGGKVGDVENFTASQGTYKDKIVLSWSRVPNATRYWIVRFNGTGWEEVAKVKTNSFEDTSDTVKGGNLIAYSLRAGNDSEYGNASRAAWGKTNPNLARAGEMPEPPRNVSAKLVGDTAKISWTKVPGAVEYYVFRKRHGAGYGLAGSVKSANFSENLPNEPGLWLYQVRTKSATGGESVASQTVAVSKNTIYPSVARRGGDAVLTSLAGTWQANVHELDQAVATATVTVSGNNVDILLDVAGRSAKFSGIYASGSGVLEANGVKLSKTDAQMNVILLSCRNAALCRKPFREGFIRIR
ncbi:MAG: hypothetical protein J0L53_16285 [Spirochaetes bacterium]|nr:hypothetical protein [Spirochaetota bacterium]